MIPHAHRLVMWRAGVNRAQPTGLAAYLVAEAVADGVLALADHHRVSVAFIEVVCSDWRVRRRRLEHRSRGIVGFEEPTWEAVQQRRFEYEPWTDHRLVLDSTADLASNVTKAQEYLAAGAPPSQPVRH
ncbi:hypothetical protein BX281_10364 [Streptomyces sp. Ag82_O1-15]|uniref:hypothetical protein n=1 Tax=Streptomyces sp. Ag82_O1-15 TaxID=1938855 RepID=UPI000BD1A142|nr:hypothetical protein [Streptomyces sp. Ag82_O1-15]PBD02136.1 hypothetical protein BX281_10364 [Streptomyces sp. Ag82_O1-15]